MVVIMIASNTLQFQYFWDFNKLSFENFWLYFLGKVAMTQHYYKSPLKVSKLKD